MPSPEQPILRGGWLCPRLLDQARDQAETAMPVVRPGLKPLRIFATLYLLTDGFQ